MLTDAANYNRGSRVLQHAFRVMDLRLNVTSYRPLMHACPSVESPIMSSRHRLRFTAKGRVRGGISGPLDLVTDVDS